MQHSTVIDVCDKGTHSTTYMNRQQVHRQVLSSDVADSMRRVIITMVKGNGQVTDLDEVMDDRCVVGTTGVCVWEQLNCKQGHAILQLGGVKREPAVNLNSEDILVGVRTMVLSLVPRMSRAPTQN